MISDATIAPDTGSYTLYVRPGGDDSNPGTADQPLATFVTAMSRLQTHSRGSRYCLVDITGIDETVGSWSRVEAPISAATTGYALPGPNDHVTWLYQSPLMVRATLQTLYGPLSGAVYVAEPVHGMLRVTVPGATWTAGELRGLVLSGSGFFETGVIADNTSDTVWVSYGGPYTEPLHVYGPGAILRLGDTTDWLNAYTPGLNLVGSSDLVIHGVDLRSNTAGNALQVVSQGHEVTLSCCRIDGLTTRGRGRVVLDATELQRSFFWNDSEGTFRRCSFYQVQGSYHSGSFYATQTRARDCGSLGHGGTSQPDGSFEYDQLEALDSWGVAVTHEGAGRSALRNSVISGAGSHGVSTRGPGRLLLDNVQGSGNDGYGAEIRNGAQVEVRNGTGIAGSLGEVRLGGVGTVLWSSAPNVDNCNDTTSELTRIYPTGL